MNNAKLVCSHNFHLECINKIRKLECPTCRRRLSGIPDEILKGIVERETIDKKRREIERELAANIIRLEDLENMIESFTIAIPHSI